MEKIRRLRAWVGQIKAQRALACLCVGIVFARMVFPKLTFDMLSLYLILAGAACVILPDMAKLLAQLRRAKIGGVDIEFEIDALAERTDAIAAAKSTEDDFPEPAHEDEADARGDDSKIDASDRQADDEPTVSRAIFTSDYVESKSALFTQLVRVTDQLIAEVRQRSAGILKRTAPFDPIEAMDILAAYGAVDSDSVFLFRDLMQVRNQIVHGQVPGILRYDLIKLVNTAETIRRLVTKPTRINVNEDWELRYWADKLGVSVEDLSRAIKRVGNKVTDVSQELKRPEDHRYPDN